MVMFSGNVAAPGPCVIRSFLTGQKGSEKPAANSEARGTAKGACGPLWKPRRSNGVARDGFRFSQGKCSLLQYRFFPAGTAHPGSRSETPPAFAGGNVCGKHLLYPFTYHSRPVRRGRMHAARARLPHGNVFLRVRGTLICRGGIYASRQGCAPRGVPGVSDWRRSAVSERNRRRRLLARRCATGPQGPALSAEILTPPHNAK